eukprot:g52542.t1
MVRLWYTIAAHWRGVRKQKLLELGPKSTAQKKNYRLAYLGGRKMLNMQLFLLLGSACLGSALLLVDGQEVPTTFSADPAIRAVRFSPTWFDAMEGALDWALRKGYQSFAFTHQDLTKAEEGFNLSLVNHNLQPARWDPARQSWHHWATLELIAGDAAFVQSALNASKSDQLILYLGPGSGSELDCPLPANWLSAPLSRNASRFCLSPLPFAPSHGQTLQQAVQDTTELFFVQLNSSAPPGIWQGAAWSVQVTGRQGSQENVSYTIPVGPLHYDSAGCPTQWCLQGSRRSFVFPLFGDAGADLSRTARIGEGASNRGFCGAPSEILPPAERSIVIGQSAALTGSTRHLGLGMRKGMLQGLTEAWTAADWPKPRIILLSYDDEYEPVNASANTLQLVEKDQVSLLAGYVGTPTSKVIFDYVNHTGIPFVCPFTGARFLRWPYVPNIVNIRSSYDDEAEGMVAYLTVHSKLRVSLFHQNDSFGASGRDALTLALAKRGLSIYSSGSYQRNTLNVEQAVADLQATELIPDAVVMVGAAKPTAKFVYLASKAGSRWHDKVQAGLLTFIAISFTGTIAYKAELQAWGVAPVPTDGQGATSLMMQEVLIPDVSDRSTLWDPVYSEGYICGQFLGSAIKRIPANVPVTSATFLGSVKDTGLFKVKYSNTQLTVGPYDGECSQGLRGTFTTAFTASFESKLIRTLDLGGCGVSLDSSIQRPPVVFGQSAPFSGPNRELGIDLKAGIVAAFERTNREGGIQGRLLQLKSLDDGYEPALTVNNTKRFLEKDKVFALLGYIGTPTTFAILNYATVVQGSLIIAPFTGARGLRYPFDPNVVNLRASYDDEVHAFVEYCFAKGKELISIFYQDDGYGMAGYVALETQLLNRGVQILSKGKYKRNTLDVEEGLAQMLSESLPQPQAVVLIGTARALAKFIALARPKWPDVLFHTVSFVGAEVFASELLQADPEALLHVFVTQVVPNPFEDNPLVLDFLNDLQASCPSCRPSYAAMEGYMSGLLVKSVLSRMNLDPELDRFEPASFPDLRQRFKDALYDTSRFLLGNIFLGPFATICGQRQNCLDACNQGMRSVELTQVVAANGTGAAMVLAAFPDFRYASQREWTFGWSKCNEHITLVEEMKRPFLVVQSAPLSGDSAKLGFEVSRGLRAAIEEYNAGSPATRNITLLCYDDGYNPARTSINFAHAQTLKPMAFAGFIGTPTTMAIIDQVRGSKVPFVGPFTGAHGLRYPFNIQPEVLNIRAGYDEEVAMQVQDAVLVRKAARISLFAQNDAFGSAGRFALNLALKYWKMNKHSEGTYVRNTRDVEPGLCELLLKKPGLCDLKHVQLEQSELPDAVVMIGTALALADFVELAGIELPMWNPHFYTVSFVGPEQFIGELRLRNYARLDRIYISAVVPPTPQNIPDLWNDFDKSMQLLDESFQGPHSLAALEGYLVGSLLVRLIEVTKLPTPASVLKSAYTLQAVEVHGVELGPYVNNSETGCNQGSGLVYLTQAGVGGDGWDVVNSIQLKKGQCGVFEAFSDGTCPTGTEKIYLNPDQNLAFECRLPKPREIVDVGISRAINIGLLTVGCLLLTVSVGVMAVLYLFRTHPILKISSVFFRFIIMLGIVLIQLCCVVIAGDPTDTTCSAFIWMLQLGFAMTMGNMALIVYRLHQIMSFANRKRFQRVHLPNSYLAIGSCIILAINLVLLGIWQSQDPPSVKFEVYDYQRYPVCSFNSKASGVSFMTLAIMLDLAVLIASVLLAYRLQKVLMSKYRDASDLREVTMASYNVTVLCVIFIPMLVLLEGNSDLHLVLLGSFAGLLSATLLSSIFGRRFFILWRYPTKEEYLANKQDSGGDTSGSYEYSWQRYLDMPDDKLLEFIKNCTPEELMLRLRGGKDSKANNSHALRSVNSFDKGKKNSASHPAPASFSPRSVLSRMNSQPNKSKMEQYKSNLSYENHSVLELDPHTQGSAAQNESAVTPGTKEPEQDWKDVEIQFVVDDISDEEDMAQIPAEEIQNQMRPQSMPNLSTPSAGTPKNLPKAKLGEASPSPTDRVSESQSFTQLAFEKSAKVLEASPMQSQSYTSFLSKDGKSSKGREDCLSESQSDASLPVMSKDGKSPGPGKMREASTSNSSPTSPKERMSESESYTQLPFLSKDGKLPIPTDGQIKFRESAPSTPVKLNLTPKTKARDLRAGVPKASSSPFTVQINASPKVRTRNRFKQSDGTVDREESPSQSPASSRYRYDSPIMRTRSTYQMDSPILRTRSTHQRTPSHEKSSPGMQSSPLAQRQSSPTLTSQSTSAEIAHPLDLGPGAKSAGASKQATEQGPPELMREHDFTDDLLISSASGRRPGRSEDQGGLNSGSLRGLNDETEQEKLPALQPVNTTPTLPPPQTVAGRARESKAKKGSGSGTTLLAGALGATEDEDLTVV